LLPMGAPSSALTFGAWVRKHRKALGLTQAELAWRAGCSGEMIRKVESDRRRPSSQLAELLARVLEIDPADHAAFLRAARLARQEQPEAPRESERAAPAEGDRLIGRAQLAAQLVGSLRGGADRLITLTGPAGVGKTSLAAHAAAEVGAEHRFVPLATVRRPDDVLPAIALALGLPPSARQASFDQLAGHVGARRLLIVLDNMEQVAEAAPSVAALLEACPHLSVLVTSRLPLRARGEQVIEVPPLEVPGGAEGDPAVLLRASAAELFALRAREARPDFAVTVANAGAVAALCRRMDGLPLAIELVAARSNVLAPQALLERLSGAHGYAPLELPGSPLPAAHARHQSLRAAIGWSFDLLSPSQMRLFAWLGVFSGGFTLAAAEAVCASAELRPIDVLDGLQALLDAHLVVRQPAANDTLRFRMLLTIQEFALERLAEAGEREAAQLAHANYYLEAVKVERKLFQGVDQDLAMDRLEADHDNLRAALRWLQEHHLGRAAELGAALWWFWYVRSHWRDGYAWLEGIMRRYEEQPVPLSDYAHAQLLRGAAVLAEELSLYERSLTWSRQSLAISYAAENWRGTVATLNNMAGLYHLQGRSDEARRCLEEALPLSRRGEFPVGLATTLGCLASLETDLGRLEQAQACLDESMAIMEQLAYQYGIVNTLLYQGTLDLAQKSYGLAHERYTRALALSREQNDAFNAALALHGLGHAHSYQGDPRQGLRYHQEALRFCLEHGAQQATITCLEGCGVALGAIGAIDAAMLFAAAAAAREQLGMPNPPRPQQALGAAIARAASAHRAAEWEAAWARGQAMSLAQASTYALSLRCD
jgi:predicted ATPase/DNA-binding XRE family transcriptional regulator